MRLIQAILSCRLCLSSAFFASWSCASSSSSERLYWAFTPCPDPSVCRHASSPPLMRLAPPLATTSEACRDGKTCRHAFLYPGLRPQAHTLNINRWAQFSACNAWRLSFSSMFRINHIGQHTWTAPMLLSKELASWLATLCFCQTKLAAPTVSAVTFASIRTRKTSVDSMRPTNVSAAMISGNAQAANAVNI
eukprot:6179314-Pleurochrysis_carterae.AAC.1